MFENLETRGAVKRHAATAMRHAGSHYSQWRFSEYYVDEREEFEHDLRVLCKSRNTSDSTSWEQRLYECAELLVVAIQDCKASQKHAHCFGFLVLRFLCPIVFCCKLVCLFNIFGKLHCERYDITRRCGQRLTEIIGKRISRLTTKRNKVKLVDFNIVELYVKTPVI